MYIHVASQDDSHLIQGFLGQIEPENRPAFLFQNIGKRFSNGVIHKDAVWGAMLGAIKRPCSAIEV